MKKKELYARIVELEKQNGRLVLRLQNLLRMKVQYGPSQSDFDAVVKTSHALDAELVETKKKLEELTARVADLTAENTRLQKECEKECSRTFIAKKETDHERKIMSEMAKKAFEIVSLGGGLANL